MFWHPLKCGFPENAQDCITALWDHPSLTEFEKPFSICHMISSLCPMKDFFPLFMILIPYARSDFLTILNMCQTLFVRVKLFRRTICKQRKSSSALTRMHILARLDVQSWVLKQVWPAVGSIWALICNSRLHPGVHLWDKGRAPSHIDLPEFLSQRRWGEGRRGTRWRH